MVDRLGMSWNKHLLKTGWIFVVVIQTCGLQLLYLIPLLLLVQTVWHSDAISVYGTVETTAANHFLVI